MKATIDDLKILSFQELPSFIDSTSKEIENEMESIYQKILKKSDKSEKNEKSDRKIKKLHKITQKKVSLSLIEVKQQFENLINEKNEFLKWSENEMLKIEQEKSILIKNRDEDIYPIVESPSGRVILNIGGTIFETTRSTLTSDQRSIFASMFSGRYYFEPDSDGSYFIDRDPTHFKYILNFLRDSNVYLPPNKTIYQELMIEAEFYELEAMLEILKVNLRKLQVALEPYGSEAEKNRIKGKSKI